MNSNSLDVVIAVMGITGAGKSSFIKKVSGRQDVVVGHGQSSATEHVTPYRFQYGETNFTIVDTPGFDDSRCTDDVIADRLLEWLRQSMQAGTKISGVIYIHRIIDPRMQGTALSAMNMFRRLCGPDCFPNVVLATSFWSEVDPTQGALRERELLETDEFWGQLVKKGSSVMRIGLDDKADQRLLLKIAQNSRVLLQAQQEMQDGRRNFETLAAQEAKGELSRWRLYFDNELEAEKEHIRQEMEEQRKRAKENLDAQRAGFLRELQAQKQTRQQDEADNAAMKRVEVMAVSQQEGLKQLRKALDLEYKRQEKIQQEERYSIALKCRRSTRHGRLKCNSCGRMIKHRRRQFYRK